MNDGTKYISYIKTMNIKTANTIKTNSKRYNKSPKMIMDMFRSTRSLNRINTWPIISYSNYLHDHLSRRQVKAHSGISRLHHGRPPARIPLLCVSASNACGREKCETLALFLLIKKDKTNLKTHENLYLINE